MTNLATIKDHLKKLRPKFLLFFSYKNDKIANTQKRFPCVAINRCNILDEKAFKETIFDKDVNENEDFANNTDIYLFYSSTNQWDIKSLYIIKMLITYPLKNHK